MSTIRVSLKVLLLAFIACFFGISAASAQNAFDALRYSLEYPGGGSVTMSMPGAGVSVPQGLGSALDNPASLGLVQSSSTFLDLSFRNIAESTSYLGTNQSANDSQTSLSNLGFIHKVPTAKGSLVWGVGYSQTVDFNRTVDVNGYNDQSSVTFMFNEDGFYGDPAYNAFAIDSIGTRTQSVFRFGQFQGVRQRVKMIESGQMGEINAFLSTEFQKNLFVGVDLGIPMGSYSYERTFLEEDSRNLYDGRNGTYDVKDMLNVDEIDADISGLRARVGILYKLRPNINIGMSFQFPTRLKIEESYSTVIETTFDNGDLFDDQINGDVSYNVRSPQRISLGLGAKDLHGITATVAAEMVGYSSIEMQNLGTRIEIEENEFISQNFATAYNIKTSFAYRVTPFVRPFVGYAYYPSPRKGFAADRQFFSGGINLGTEKQLNFSLGVQYGIWSDELVLYNYFPRGVNSSRAEVVDEDITRVQVMAGLSYNF